LIDAGSCPFTKYCAFNEKENETKATSNTAFFKNKYFFIVNQK
jgi:hypothetical protein